MEKRSWNDDYVLMVLEVHEKHEKRLVQEYLTFKEITL